MNGKEIAQKIREEKIGSQDKRALIVEGVDDVLALTILLNRHHSNWEKSWVIEEAGSKSKVQTVLKEEGEWLGLVDRDEWGEDFIREKADEQLNLIPLPRFCLENYLINPREIWPVIPEQQQQRVEGGADAFTAAILESLPAYLRHGVLWKVVTPLWSGLRSLGFKEALAAQGSIETAQNDSEIKRYLNDWDELLDPERIFNEFEEKLAIVNALPEADQLNEWVHGKVFWQKVVNPAMDQLIGQMSVKDRKRGLWGSIEMPSDLQPLVDRLTL